jgi:uncharacterized protein Usg
LARVLLALLLSHRFEEVRMADAQFKKQWLGYGLTTAEILYRLPDHPAILQSYVWQDYDRAPDFPELHGFLAFWTKNLDGPIHGVRVAHQGLIKPAEFKAVGAVLTLH